MDVFKDMFQRMLDKIISDLNIQHDKKTILGKINLIYNSLGIEKYTMTPHKKFILILEHIKIEVKK